MLPVHLSTSKSREDEMKPSWEHAKEAITTDQKFRVDDEHLHELDKRHLKESEENPELIPKKGKPGKSKRDEG
jgi:hypothetical protein